jgi:Na+-driven multidrug efflux pump
MGTCFNLWVLRRKGLLQRDTIPPLRWMRVAWRYLFRVAWPAGLMQVLWQTGYLVLYAITASLPVDRVDALAGLTAGMRIEAILFLPGFALNMTASILVGHHLGARQPEEAKRLGWQILAIGAVSMGLLAVVLWQFAQPVAAILSPEAAVQKNIVEYLFYNLIAIPFTVGSMILGGVMVGAGATIYNMTVFGISAWLVRLPLAYLLGHHLWRDPTGVWAAMLASQTVQCLTLLYLFQFKDWSRFSMRGRRIRPPQPGGIPKHGSTL